jgi:adenylate cyclase
MLRRSFVIPNIELKTLPVPGRSRLAWSRWKALARTRWPASSPVQNLAEHGNITRLMTALYADMAGYSRLFALDDTGTVARLRTLHHDLIEPTIHRHHGALVQTGGDSMLIIFDSVAQAVKCAISIQSATAIDSNDNSNDRRIRFRIGVDLGDIIMDGMNYHGDGVIVAARLQAVCPPGGVCVSRAVHERGGDRLGLPTQALGPLTLKHVARPVEAFVLWPAPQAIARLAG